MQGSKCTATKEPTKDFQLSACVLYYWHTIHANASIIGTLQSTGCLLSNPYKPYKKI